MSGSTDSKVIECFLYDNHIYHWVAIEGRNCRGYHLGIPQSCNRISSFASSNNSNESKNEKTNIHHSLIRTLRDTTKYEIIVSAFNKFVKNPNYNSKIRQSSEIKEIDRVESNNNGNKNEDKTTNIEKETEMKKSKEIGNEYCKATHDGSDTITTENNEIIEEQTENKEFENQENNDCNELTECNYNAESTQNNETQTCENTNEKKNEPRYIEVPKYNWQCQCTLCNKITINNSECKSRKNKNKNRNKNKNKNKNGKNKYRVCDYQHWSDVYEIDSMKEESNESNLNSNSITNNNGNNSNNNINRSMKHGLVIAFTGHGNKNGDMCIGATKITPTLSEQKQFKKLRKKYEKENLGFGFADLFENTNEFEDYKGIWDETNQLISLQGLIYNMIEIINQHSLYYNINIDHLLILNDGCHSGNWCYKLKSVLNDNSINKIIGNINVTIVASCEKNNLAYELQGNPNDGGRFYKLLLGNKNSTYKHDCKLNENCKFCESIKHKRKKTHKQYYKHKNKCDEFNNEIIIANHNNMLIKWSNEEQKMIVVQSKFQ